MKKKDIDWADLIPCTEQNRIMPVGLTLEEGRGAFVPRRLAEPWIRRRALQVASLPLETLKSMPYFNDYRTKREVVLMVYPLSGTQGKPVIYMNPAAFAYFNVWLNLPHVQRFKTALEGGTWEMMPDEAGMLSRAFLEQLLAEMGEPHRPRDSAKVGTGKIPSDPANKNEPS